MSNTTFQAVIDFYLRFEPKTGVTEQVKGFGMRTSASEPESPLNKHLVSIETWGGWLATQLTT